MDGNGWKWLEIAGHGWEWLGIAGMAGNGSQVSNSKIFSSVGRTDPQMKASQD